MNSNLFKQAHKMTREDMKLYSGLNYRMQFGLNLKALYSKKMTKLDFLREKFEVLKAYEIDKACEKAVNNENVSMYTSLEILRDFAKLNFSNTQLESRKAIHNLIKGEIDYDELEKEWRTK